MKTIRWGIIGCGAVTEKKSGPAFKKARNSELIAVMRRTTHLAKDYAKRHNVPKWYDAAEALINDPDVDAVYIATPPKYHKPHALAAIEAGKPVYVEKPMALDSAECKAMNDAAKKNDVPLFIAYYRRAQPKFRKIKALLDAGVIGEIRLITTEHKKKPEPGELKGRMTWHTDPSVSGGGHFHDLACHTLDLLDYFFGPLQDATGIASNQGGLYSADDTVSGLYRLENGAHGKGTWFYAAAEEEDRTVITGTKGKLIFSTFADDPVRLITAEGVKEYHFDKPEHVEQPLIQAIVDALNGKGRSPSTGITGARTSLVMDRMTKKNN